MNISLEAIILAMANLVAIGVAFGNLRGRLTSQDRVMELIRKEEYARSTDLKKDMDIRMAEVKEEIKINRDRMHDFVNRHHELILEMIRKEG